MDALIIAVGLLLVALSVIAVEGFRKAIVHPEVFAKRLSVDFIGRPTERSKLYSGAMLAGAFVTNTAAVYGLLFWLPALERLLPNDFFADGSPRFPLALLAGFFLTGVSSRIFEAFDELRRLGIARSTMAEAKSMAAQLGVGSSVDKVWADFEASDNAYKADRAWLRGFLEDLRRALHSAVPSRPPENTPSEAVVPSSPGIPMDDVHRGLETLKSLDAALPSIVGDRSNEITELPPHCDGIYVVEQSALIREFRPFKEAFAAAGVSEEIVQAGARDVEITDAILSIPATRLESNVRAIARYKGDSHGGHTQYLVRRPDGSESPLTQGLVFSPTLSGALGAFFVAHVLPTIGRYWHGRYNHDYKVHPHKVSLVLWLKRSGFTEDHAGELAALDHRAAVCVTVASGSTTISAYGSGETTPLTLFKASVTNGRLVDASRDTVLESKFHILY